MVLVDTSVWIQYFRKGEAGLVEVLTEAAVLIHPFIVGELACGNLKNRVRVLADLSALPTSRSASHDEVFRLIEDRRLWEKALAGLMATFSLRLC